MAELTAPTHGGKRQPVSHEWWLGAGSALALLYAAIMASPGVPGIDCPSTSVLHAPCPGCGMTRSLWLTATGSFDRMFALNPVAPLVLLALSIHAFTWLISLSGRRGSNAACRMAPTLRTLRWTAFAAVALWGMVRIVLVWSGILHWDTDVGLTRPR